ncbi:MAG: TRAP transporter small permease [Peptococcaceae bacterium]
MRTIKRLNLLLKRIENCLAYIASAAYLFMVVSMSFDALGRYLFNRPIPGTYEINIFYAFPIIVYLGLSYTYREKAHIAIDILVDRVSKKNQYIMSIISSLLVSVVSFLLFMQTGNRFLISFNKNEIYVGVYNFPLYIGYLVVVIGFLTLFIRSGFELLFLIYNRVRKDDINMT